MLFFFTRFFYLSFYNTFTLKSKNVLKLMIRTMQASDID
ncbi:ribosomal-protein-alanine N-acetyltransferase, partial [Acinetobacter baumannii]